METRKAKKKIKRIRRNKADMSRGVDTLKFCGILRLKGDPLAIQKRLRNEWN